MAVFGISAVRHSADGSRIIRYQVRQVTPLGVSQLAALKPKMSILTSMLRLGSDYVTIVNVGGSWQLGALVNVFFVEGMAYLRTDANRIAEDNLGNLPEC